MGGFIILLVIYLIILVHALMFDQWRIRRQARARECEALGGMELELQRNLARSDAGDSQFEQINYRSVICSGALVNAPLSLIALTVRAYDPAPQAPADRAGATREALDAIAGHLALHCRRKAKV